MRITQKQRVTGRLATKKGAGFPKGLNAFVSDGQDLPGCKKSSQKGKCGVLALALAVVLSGNVAVASMPLFDFEPAWADPTTNEDVPTDETGVVDSTAGESNATAGNTDQEGTDSGEVDTSLAPTPPAQNENAEDDMPEGDVPLQSDDNDTPAQEGESENLAPVQRPRPVIHDPVFGDGVSEDNLINPQQKPDSSFIYDTSIASLQTADSYMNNQTVQVTGEVVGDRIFAEFDPGYCWIVLQGDDKGRSEVPVFLTEDDTALVDTWGAYGRKGTTLQVRGTFHLSCPEHEGLTDLHASAVSLVEKGSITEQVFSLGKFVPGLVLMIVGVVMLLVFRHMREGQR